MSEGVIEGAVCKPNISAHGRRLRTRLGIGGAIVSAVWLGFSIGLHWPWGLRAVIFLPAAGSALGFLQVRRNTCVARAREGVFEHDDMSRTKAPDDEVAASRKVAAGIMRDTIAIGVGVAVVAVLTAFVS